MHIDRKLRSAQAAFELLDSFAGTAVNAKGAVAEAMLNKESDILAQFAHEARRLKHSTMCTLVLSTDAMDLRCLDVSICPHTTDRHDGGRVCSAVGGPPGHSLPAARRRCHILEPRPFRPLQAHHEARAGDGRHRARHRPGQSRESPLLTTVQLF